VVVPFLQFGLTGRAVSATVNGSNFTGTGGGMTFGAGLNAHFTPDFALSGVISWAVGNFDDFRVDNRVRGKLFGERGDGAAASWSHLDSPVSARAGCDATVSRRRQ
jgi:hypothetical protein